MVKERNKRISALSFQILLIMSNGDLFLYNELKDIAHYTDENFEEALKTLLSINLIKEKGHRFSITSSGVNYLLKTKKEKRQIKLSLFPNWQEMFTWFTFPLVLYLIATVLTIYPYENKFVSLEIIQYRTFVWISYSTLLLLYTKLSYYNVKDYEFLIHYKNGKISTEKMTGHILITPLINFTQKIDLREKLQKVKQSYITSDNVLVNIEVAIVWEIIDPISSIKVINIENAIKSLVVAAIREKISEHTLESTLSIRKELSSFTISYVQEKTKDWGINLKSCSLVDFQPPENLLRVFENRLKYALEHETYTDSQIETIRKLMVLGINVDEQALDLFKIHNNNLENESKSQDIDAELLTKNQRIEAEIKLLKRRLLALTIIIAILSPFLVLWILNTFAPEVLNQVTKWIIGLLVTYLICLTNYDLRNNQIPTIVLSIIINLVSNLISQN